MSDLVIGSQLVRWGSSEVHGLGVFAAADFDSDEIVEVCHYKRLSAIMQYHPLRDEEGNAHLVWPRDLDGDGKTGAHIPTGLALLYNHSDDPNARLRFNRVDKTLTVTAVGAIFEGGEVLIDYRETHPKNDKGF